MSFLKLGRKKGVNLEENLDMPPIPPPSLDDNIVPEVREADKSEEEFSPEVKKIKDKLPELPPLDESFKIPVAKEAVLPPLPELDEIPANPILAKKAIKPKKKFSLFGKPKKEIKKPELPPLPDISAELPEFPSMPEEDLSFKTEPETKLPFEEDIIIEKPIAEDFAVVPPIKIEKTEIKTVEKEKPLFLVMDMFKIILSEIKETRTDLKEFENSLKILGEERAEERLYLKLRSSLNDVQKKLQFVDKSLFKG